MSKKKFFTLIHGDAVHIAPETRVISAEAISTAADAKEVLERVLEDAEQYRQEVVKECETLKEKAQKDGFEEGYSQWIDRVAELEAEIKRVRSEVEKQVLPVALKVAKKIVNRELETSKTAILDIIKNTLKTVSQHKKVNLYVNPDDFEVVEADRKELAKIFEELEALSIRPRNDVTEGGCVIETEGGIINAQLENQWLILERAFDKMMQATPSEPAKEEK